MTTFRIILVAALSILVPDAVFAQADSKPVLPAGPLVNKIPGQVSWSVAYTYADETPKGQQGVPDYVQSLPRTLLMESSNGLTHVTINKINGSIENCWKTGDLDYEQFGNAPWVVGLKNGLTSNVYLDATDFPSLDWLQPSLFVGPMKYQGAECLLFVAGDTVHVSPDDPSAITTLENQKVNFAVIDLQTRFPVEVYYGGIKEAFQFGTPPKKLALPADLMAQIIQAKRADLARNVPAPRPY